MSKVNKNELIRTVAKKNKISIAEATRIYDSFVSEIYNIMAEGKSLSLTGFGLFYLHKHKGHPVQFEGDTKVNDYVVFKFSASDVFNKRLRDGYDKGEVVVKKR